jgi:hypothetical protein
MVKRAPSFQSGARFAFFANDDSGGGLDSVRVRGDRRTADMIAEQERQSPARADGETSRTGEVIFADYSVFQFVVIANVVGGDAIHNSLDLLAVRVVVEVGRRRAGDGGESVFSVVIQRELYDQVAAVSLIKDASRSSTSRKASKKA